jgi:hypothetical protein
LKERLFQLVDPEEYWTILSLFIYGECPKQRFDEMVALRLTTNEARIFHNELIRSIIFNAHFSTIPPPNATFPGHKLPDYVAAQNHRPPTTRPVRLVSYNAVDLRHLPSGDQLAKRITLMLAAKNIGVDESAVRFLFAKVKQFLLAVLKQAVQLRVAGCRGDLVTEAHIAHVLRANGPLAAAVTPSTLAKFPRI